VAFADFGPAPGSEEWLGESEMWLGSANSAGWRSPQAFAGTPNNTPEPAQTDKKKPQLITVGASVLVDPASIENRALPIDSFNVFQTMKNR